MIRSRSGRRGGDLEGTAEEFRAHFEDAQARSRLLRELLDVRHVCGKSQKNIAEAMGTVQSAVSDLEGGGTDPRLSTLQRYARAVGAKVNVGVSQWLPAELPVSEYVGICAYPYRTETQRAVVVGSQMPDEEFHSADDYLKLLSTAS